MKLLVPEIFEKASKLKTKPERINFLRKNARPAVKDMIRVQFDSSIVSLLPEGKPPYEPDDAPIGYAPSSLDKKFKMFKYFFKGEAGNAMKPVKRETMFIQLLESVHFSEAEMVVLAKDKNLKYTGITKKLCQEAFPGLITK